MSGQRKPLFRLRIRTMLLLILLLAVGWSGYSYWSDYSDQAERAARELLSPPAGAQCTVIFSSGALGLEPSSVAATQIKGTGNSVHGRFVQLNDDWIVLDPRQGPGPQRWIARQHVLLLQVEKE